uniref:non-specific serine/threonine protein kinase n=1 Tax=Angiostrongylus cantonensis TaxID=6313 RepID=A0A0K0DIY7_ANGCA
SAKKKKQNIHCSWIPSINITCLTFQENIPEITAMGTCSMGHFFIMELVGRNLSDLRRQLPHRRLSPGTLYRAMLQVTHALSLVHGAGFLHRDLKPSNCCIGVDHVTRIYLLDYGLARQYIDSSGLMRKPRESIGMRGTLRYVSLEAHARHDLGPSHDLVALLYSIIELGDGRLPWSKMRDEAAIKASKMGTTVEKLCEKQPKMLKMAEVAFLSVIDDIATSPTVAEAEICELQ